MKLIKMTDYVIDAYDKIKDSLDSELAMYRYAKFLSQPLELWMFVPCDLDGNVLEAPKITTGLYFQRYQLAKERVLFEGFEFTESQKYSVINKIKKSVHWYTDSRLYVTINKPKCYHSWFELFTIDDLIQCEITLSQTAINNLQNQ